LAIENLALAALVEQLRFVPPAAARRQVERAEALLANVEPGEEYSEEFVAFALTGFRPEGRGEPVVIGGASLRRDLAGVIERLSGVAEYREEEFAGEGGVWLSTAELAARWNVSRRTLERLRREGLVGRRVRVGGGGGRIETRYALSVVEGFERVGRMTSRSGVAAEAGAKLRADKRLSEAERMLIVRRARRYRAVLGWTMSRVAARLAMRLGRSVQAVRRVLEGHDDQAGGQAGRGAMFVLEKRLSRRERRVAARAMRVGIAARVIAQRLGVSVATVHRVELLDRAERWRAWAAGQRGAWRGADGRAMTLLGERAEGLLAEARQGRGEVALCTTVREQVGVMVEPSPAGRVRERALTAALSAVLVRAVLRAEGVDRVRPRMEDVDAVETDLRCAARLMMTLVLEQWWLLSRTIDGLIGEGAGALMRMDDRRAEGLARIGVRAMVMGIERFVAGIVVEGAAGGRRGAGGLEARLAAPVGLELTRALAPVVGDVRTQMDADGLASTVGAQAARGALGAWGMWVWTLTPWQREVEWLAVRRALVQGGGLLASDGAGHVQRIVGEDGWLVLARVGIGGKDWPRTLASLAKERGTSAAALARRERGALARLRGG
jgi:transposase